MATKPHKLLTGTDLHEPKGIETQSAGKVYVSDGAGSGAWVTINTEIGFSTGDTKNTFKTVADAGWVLVTSYAWTIGAVGSSATYSNADGQALYQLLWENIPTANAVVSGGRGGSAAADYAAGKTLQPFRDYVGRVQGWAGTNNGLATTAFGSITGSDTYSLIRSDLPNIVIPVNISDPGHAHSSVGIGTNAAGGVLAGQSGGGAILAVQTNAGANFTSTVATGISGSISLNGPQTQTAIGLKQPTFYSNVMVKL